MPSGRSDLRFCFFYALRLALTKRRPPGSRIYVFGFFYALQLALTKRRPPGGRIYVFGFLYALCCCYPVVLLLRCAAVRCALAARVPTRAIRRLAGGSVGVVETVWVDFKSISSRFKCGSPQHDLSKAPKWTPNLKT